VKVAARRYPGVAHGFIHFDPAHEAIIDVAAAVSEAVKADRR
jgi:hypothetical protein